MMECLGFASFIVSSIAAIAAWRAVLLAKESIRIAECGVDVARSNLRVAEDSLRKNLTAQVELYVLSTIKDDLLRKKKAKSECGEDMTLTRYLMTLDYWCKLILNDCLDEKLLSDNRDFIKDEISEHEPTIRGDGGYNNIDEYARRNYIWK